MSRSIAKPPTGATRTPAADSSQGATRPRVIDGADHPARQSPKNAISSVNHVWATDITYIPMKSGFVYLVAIMDSLPYTIGMGHDRGQ